MLNALLIIGALALAPAGFQGAAAESSQLTGLWLDEDGETAIEISVCGDGDQLCGRIAWLKDEAGSGGSERMDRENPDPGLRDRNVLGLQVLEGFAAQPDEDGIWQSGQLYDPSNGKTYFRCTMRFEDTDRLKIRGFRGVRVGGEIVASRFRNTSLWTRVTEGQLAAQ